MATEVRIIKENKNEIELEIVEEDHTFCNVLQNFLNAYDGILIATYKIEQPQLSSPRVYIKTKDVPLPRKEERIVPLTEVPGIGEKRAGQLQKAGVESANELIRADLEKLEKKSEISRAMLENFVAEAKKIDFAKESVARYLLKQALKDMAKTFSDIKASL